MQRLTAIFQIVPGGFIRARLMALIVLLMLFAGCASDYDKYADTLKQHSTDEATRITAQAKAIGDMVTYAKTETKTEATLLAVIGMMQVERLKPVPLGIVKPTTWADVGDSAVGHLPFAFMSYGMLKLGQSGIDNAAATTFQGDANLTNSFNRPEVHTTGSGNTSSYSGTSPPAEPIVVISGPE